MKRFEHLRDFLSRHKWRYIAGVFFLVLVDALQLIIPRLLGNITDSLRADTLTSEGLRNFVFVIIGIAGAIAAGRFLWRICIIGTARMLDFHLRNKLFAHLERLPARYFNEHKTGDLMAHATNDIPAIRQTFGQGFILLTDAVFMTTATLIILFKTAPLRLAIMSLLPFPFLALGTMFFSRLINARFRAVHEAFSALTDRAQESISGIRVMKAFVQEKAEVGRFMRVAQRSVDENVRLIRVWGIMGPMSGLASTLAFVFVLRYGSAMIIYQEISLGDFVAFTSYLAMLVWPMIAVGWVINVVQRGYAALDRINKILNEAPEVADEPGAVDLPSVAGKIEFRNVTFSYSPELPPALSNVSFTVDAGKTLAIVGRTGSGKSTIVSLLTRLYNPPPGSVFIDGHDIRQVTLKSLRDQLGVVPQEAFLFSTTIGKNIAFASDDYPEKRIEHFAQVAQVHKDISEFPEGFDTMVGERGVTLSGGQKQRVCIARSLIKEPKALVLDDCLSAVDTHTEERILRGLREYMHSRTSIIISHRISTVKDADEIIVLDDGAIVEHGSHDALVASGGLYHELYEKQLLEEELAGKN
ncbi:MAG TPA: ABC transporter ATP-binding protein [Firmicutes bacterium]|nr:ABC transporter ATP-binding protein [Bacillota bacterium]